MSGTDNIITCRDGRVLGYAEYGDPAGNPVYYFHGFPGSRLEAQVIDTVACQQGLRIIAVDRPGCGLSDFQPDRLITDWPADVVQLADALQIECFAVLGVSGGGPYALACGAKIPQRITAVTVVCSLAPPVLPGIENNMPSFARTLLFLSRWLPCGMRPVYWMMVKAFQRDPDKFLNSLAKEVATVDQMALARTNVREILIASFRDALRSGVDGGLRELYLYTHRWGFRLEDISVPVKLWHGEQDKMVPPRMGHYLSKTLPNCQASFYPDEGHYSLPINHMSEILRDLSVCL